MTRPSSAGVALLPGELNQLPAAEQALLKTNGRLQPFKKGDVLVKPGDIVDDVLRIQSGLCALRVGDRVAKLLCPGDVFISTLSREQPAWAEIQALGPGVALRFPSKLMTQVLSRHPSLLLWYFDKTLAQVTESLVFHALKSSEALESRLAQVMWQVSEPLPDGSRRVPKALTQSVLASLFGVTREEINRKRKLLLGASILREVSGETLMPKSTRVLLANLA